VPAHPDLRSYAYLGKVAWAPHTGGLADLAPE
jgi:hypothetical protein